MTIIETFPIFNIGDKVKLDPTEQGGVTEGEVIKVWYPKKGESWSETDECKTIGYLNSKYNLPFPQLMLKITEPKNKVREDRMGILHINPNEFIQLK